MRKGYLILPLLGGAVIPASAQTSTDPYANWPGVELVEGIAFQGDGGITLEGSEAGIAVVKFWRPVLFKENSKRPVAGRMDCSVAAADTEFTEEVFDLEARHEAVEDRRRDQGLREESRKRDFSDTKRQLDIIGRRNAPHEHFVLSYIAVRDGTRLIDIRRNCTFVHRDGAGKPDWLAYVNRYTTFRFAFEPDFPRPHVL